MRAAGVSAWQFLTPAAAGRGGIGIFTVTVYNPVASKPEGARDTGRDLKLGRSKNSGENELWIRQRSPTGRRSSVPSGPARSGSSSGASPFSSSTRRAASIDRVEGEPRSFARDIWELRKVRRITAGAWSRRPSRPMSLSTNLTPEQVRQSLLGGGFSSLLGAAILVAQDRGMQGSMRRAITPISVAFGAPDAVCGDGVRGRFCFLKIFPVWWCGADGSRWCGFGLCALCRTRLVEDLGAAGYSRLRSRHGRLRS